MDFAHLSSVEILPLSSIPKTLELMCRVVGQENVEAVCGHLLSALRDTRDPYEARSLASRTLDLAYKYPFELYFPCELTVSLGFAFLPYTRM